MDLSLGVIWIGFPLLASYIAYRKKRSWVGVLVLTLVAPPLGILAALLVSPHPSTGKPNRAVAKFLFGLLPFWAAVTFLVFGGKGQSHDYWNVAPWLIVAAIPVSIVTLALVEVFSNVASNKEN